MASSLDGVSNIIPQRLLFSLWSHVPVGTSDADCTVHPRCLSLRPQLWEYGIYMGMVENQRGAVRTLHTRNSQRSYQNSTTVSCGRRWVILINDKVKG